MFAFASGVSVLYMLIYVTSHAKTKQSLGEDRERSPGPWYVIEDRYDQSWRTKAPTK